MAKGYWVVHLDVTDVAAYQKYRDFVQPFLEMHGARFVVRGGQQTVKEGSVRPRTVIVEWPSYAEAERAYQSAEYAEGKKLRMAISAADFAVVEGID